MPGRRYALTQFVVGMAIGLVGILGLDAWLNTAATPPPPPRSATSMQPTTALHLHQEAATTSPLTAAATTFTAASSVDSGPIISDDGCEDQPPLLILATTAAEPEPGRPLPDWKQQVQLNSVLATLTLSEPTAVLPLLFTKSAEWATIVEVATLGGGAGQPSFENTFASKFERKDSANGWPVFADIMAAAERKARDSGAKFFGYANGDIVFTEDLLVTLRMLDQANRDGFLKRFAGRERARNTAENRAHNNQPQPDKTHGGVLEPVLIVGRRTNFELTKHSARANLGFGADTSSTSSNGDDDGTCERSQRILAMAKGGELFGTSSCDFFLMAVQVRANV